MTIPPRSSFSLSGPSISLDARVHAVRGDLADIALAGQLFAPHYARPLPTRCVTFTTMMYGTPSDQGKAVSQLLFGEEFMLLDISGGWAWGYCSNDHYVGYVLEDTIADSVQGEVLGIVGVHRATLYDSPETGAANAGALPMGASVFGENDGDFVKTKLGYVKKSAIGAGQKDAAAVAESLVDTPYVWGGRCATGIDCSGLIQLSLALTGMSAPRDSDQQEASLGKPLLEHENLRRNDIVFFPGHVGIMEDEGTIIHATMHYQKTVIEPLSDVEARHIAQSGIGITSRRRLG